jgi:hypothetical protein
MAISITQNQSGGDPTPSLPNVSGMNVANVTTAPAPLAGTPTVNPNENPYAAAPFLAQAKLAGDVGDIAGKAEDYVRDVQAANQAMAVDTARTKYNTLQMKSVNDINARARTEGWSTDLDRVQQEYQGAHDENWAATVGAVKVSNPEVKRMAARLEMGTADQNSRQANEFGIGEVQTGARNNVQTQIKEFGDQLSLDSQVQPGDTVETYAARTAAAAAAYHVKIANLQQDPHFAAILPAGELQTTTNLGAQKALGEWLIGQRMTFGSAFNSGFKATIDSKGVTDPTAVAANDIYEKTLTSAYGQVVDNSGVNGPLGDIYKGDFTKTANQQRKEMETGANNTIINTQHEAAVKMEGQLVTASAAWEKSLYEGTATPNTAIKLKDNLLFQISKSDASPDDKVRLSGLVNERFYGLANQMQKQQLAKENEALKQRLGLGAGDQGAVNGSYTTTMQKLGASTFSSLPPETQGQVLNGLFAAQGGSAVAPTLPTYLKGEFASGIRSTMPLDPNKPNGPTQADRTAVLIDNLRTTAPHAYADLDEATRNIATRIVTDRQPAKDAIAAVTTAKIDDNAPETRDIQRDGLKSLGYQDGMPKNPSKFLGPLFDQLHAVGQDTDANGNRVDTSTVSPSVMSSYVQEIKDNLAKGQTPESAQLTAANTLVSRGFGLSTLSGSAKPVITLRSPENIVGAPALSAPGVLEADIRSYAGGTYNPGHAASAESSIPTGDGSETVVPAQSYQPRVGIPPKAPIVAEPVPGQFDKNGNQVLAISYYDADTHAWVPVVRTAANGQQVPYTFDKNNNYVLNNEKLRGQFEQAQSRYLAEEARQAQSQGFIRNGNSWGKMGIQGVGEAGALERFLPDHDAAVPVQLSTRDQSFPQTQEAFRAQFAAQNKGTFNQELWDKVNK